MWLQYTGVDWYSVREEGKDEIKFVNSQRSAIWFTIATDPEDRVHFQYGGHKVPYDFFRMLKYQYIRENHPTIWEERNRVK